MDPRSPLTSFNKNHPVPAIGFRWTPPPEWSIQVMELQPSPHTTEVPPACKMRMGHVQNIEYGPTVSNCRYHQKIGRWEQVYAHFDQFLNVPRNQSLLCRASCKEHGSGSIKPSDFAAGVTCNPHGSLPNETWRFLQTIGKIHKYQSHFFFPSLAQNFRHWTFNMNIFVPAWTLRYLRYLRSRLCSTASEFHSPRGEPAKGERRILRSRQFHPLLCSCPTARPSQPRCRAANGGKAWESKQAKERERRRVFVAVLSRSHRF